MMGLGEDVKITELKVQFLWQPCSAVSCTRKINPISEISQVGDTGLETFILVTSQMDKRVNYAG